MFPVTVTHNIYKSDVTRVLPESLSLLPGQRMLLFIATAFTC